MSNDKPKVVEGNTYETNDGLRVTLEPVTLFSYNEPPYFLARHPKGWRYFTEDGRAICRFDGETAVTDETRSIDPEEIDRVNNYDGPPDHFGEPEITNEERLRSGMVKPR